LNRKQWMLPILGIMIVGTAGCAGNNRAGVNENYQDNARPIGYYSNENHPNQTNALFTDNDGPLTEMMDHTLGTERGNPQNQARMLLQGKINNENPSNLSGTPATNNRLNTSNTNYSGNLNQRNTAFSTDPNTLGKMSDQIRSQAAKVKNVQDVRSVVYRSSVLITVKLKDKSQAEKTKQAIVKAIQPYADGRSITVITDKGTLRKEQNINNLRAGSSK
jgi:spore cortex protein